MGKAIASGGVKIPSKDLIFRPNTKEGYYNHRQPDIRAWPFNMFGKYNL